MEFQSYFPIWDKLNKADQDRITHNLIARRVTKSDTHKQKDV